MNRDTSSLRNAMGAAANDYNITYWMLLMSYNIFLFTFLYCFSSLLTCVLAFLSVKQSVPSIL